MKFSLYFLGNLTDEEVDRELIKIINEEKRVLFKEANSDIKRIKAINNIILDLIQDYLLIIH